MNFSDYRRTHELEGLLIIGNTGIYLGEDWVVAVDEAFAVYTALRPALTAFALHLKDFKYPRKLAYNSFMNIYADLQHIHTFGCCGIYRGYGFHYVQDYHSDVVFTCESLRQAITKTLEILR